MKPPLLACVALALVCLAPLPAAARSSHVAIDAKDVALPEVIKLLASQGGPNLAVHPDLVDEKITFAVKETSASAALRWLCRACTLAVVTSSDGRTFIARPSVERPVEKEYKLAKLATTQEEIDPLMNFIKKVIFELHPNRDKNEAGVLHPAFEMTCDKGRLTVLATPLVQREILALLVAAAKVKPQRGLEDVRVSYRPAELGFLTAHGNPATPKLIGDVKLEIANAKASEAAWALTSASKMSFFVDPWDPTLSEAKVTLQGEKLALSDAVDAFEKQLGVERCWYDEAWLFVRKERKPLFDSLTVRVYSIAGMRRFGFGGFGVGGFLRGLVRQAGDAAGLPFAMEQAGDLVYLSGPADWHKGLEDFVKNPLGGGPGPGPGPGGRPGGRRGP